MIISSCTFKGLGRCATLLLPVQVLKTDRHLISDYIVVGRTDGVSLHAAIYFLL